MDFNSLLCTKTKQGFNQKPWANKNPLQALTLESVDKAEQLFTFHRATKCSFQLYDSVLNLRGYFLLAVHQHGRRIVLILASKNIMDNKKKNHTFMEQMKIKLFFLVHLHQKISNQARNANLDSQHSVL